MSGMQRPISRWSRRLRIRTRLGLAFGLLLLLLMGLAALSVYRLTGLSEALNRIVDDQAVIRDSVNEINRNAEAVARKLLVLMSPDAELRVAAYPEINSANNRLDDAMQRLAMVLPAGPRTERLADVRQRLADYRTSYVDVRGLIERDDFQAARALLGSDTESALSLFVSAIHQLAASEERAGTAQARELRDQIDADRTGVLALCIGALIAGALLAVGVTRSIINPLKQAEDGAELIAQGQYGHRITVDSADELGHMAAAMNTMAAAVGEREAELRRLADVDLLTGLPQRARFIADGDRLLASLPEREQQAVLICIDVDRLKAVNSVLGFDAGDALLRGAAAKLEGLFEGVAAYGRLAGGTFAALAPVAQLDHGAALAAQLREEVEHKLSWQGQSLDLSVSLGVAHWPEHAADTEALLRRAEQAMFEAKRLRQDVAVFNPSAEAARALHLSLLSDLATAIQQDQLRQFLQPKRCLKTGRITGAEALVRWQHPQRGWLPPGDFVPFAERSGRIRQITDWMLARAVRTLAAWEVEGREPMSIAVNISTLDIQDQTLPARLAALLAEYRVDPGQLQLEVTETGLMSSGTDPIAVLNALKAWGVKLAIDDFGTGQSSLAYLQHLPVDELKIDRSFVQDVNADPRRQALLKSIVGVGQGLGLTVTAEGVENQAELDCIAACGCDLIQGYLLAKPMDLPDFQTWLGRTG
ncbi:diguanylate cyclase (GGDEF)-like protein [Pelomonas saccharophila]|uniref:Diguanylate cyclase (GGDEF)-like protein n=1 Tax=Roseateles saccharophilus TaxID=304 RepID=A0ABU1YR08_ROSSA|nr:EAL domain-containing protein [Roseateles saccharophilus]MDR7270386.1 diguanylate cyclase (GGDEF)-like protein [Roseateles saccharophilus]